MDPRLQSFAAAAAELLELCGVGLIVLLVLHSLGRAAADVGRRRPGPDVVREARHGLARGILLGLELLVAADIIHTVAVDLTFTTVGVLALVVVVRTFLSYSLEVEVSGRWPWQRERSSDHTSASTPKAAP